MDADHKYCRCADCRAKKLEDVATEIFIRLVTIYYLPHEPGDEQYPCHEAWDTKAAAMACGDFADVLMKEIWPEAKEEKSA